MQTTLFVCVIGRRLSTTTYTPVINAAAINALVKLLPPLPLLLGGGPPGGGGGGNPGCLGRDEGGGG